MSAVPTPEEVAAVLAALHGRDAEAETGHAAWRTVRREAVRAATRRESATPRR